MAERIYKLQPNRTMALRGFDALGASAAMHSATANSFKVTGNFRDASDFCVLILWDVDDYYEHPSIKYLPDSNFDGLTLTFDVQYTGLQPLDSAKYPSIDWLYLDYINMADESTGRINLFLHATQSGGNYTAASATFTVVDNGLEGYDRVTLWYQNIAFDYIVPYPAVDESGNPVTASTVASTLAGYINGANYGLNIGLTAVANGAEIVVTCNKPGLDGNMIGLYQLNKNNNLLITPSAANLTGGDSSAIWTVTLDFSALGLTDIRQMWLTFAPALANASAYAGGDWEAVFTNWTLSGPEDVMMLQVAGLNSVRVQQSSRACTYSGDWAQITGFYDQAFANRANTVGSTARIRYSCAVTHDLYVGTLLSNTAGEASVQLDGDTETTLKCTLGNGDTPFTRRLIRSGVAPGQHAVTLVMTLGQFFDFNFLEAAVASDIPAPLAPRPNFSPALDFDTDHTYKLPPARILWILDQLGFQATINQYLGVFWWNQRTNVGGAMPSMTVTFGGTFVSGDSIFLDIGAPLATSSDIDLTLPYTTISKSVFPADTLDTIAAHFAYFINGAFAGIWASVSGPVLTITSRSAAYAFAFRVNPATSSAAGTITPSGVLSGGSLGNWYVDPTQSPAVNTGTRAWHNDFYSLCQARGTDVVTSISMELVNPPSGYSALFHDQTEVATDTGFGTYVSNHCAIGGPMLGFQQAVLAELAALQTAAGLTPFLQMGEFLWWYFTEPVTGASMAYYDPATTAAAQAALGRDLYLFQTPNDDPGVNGGADALFLRNRLRNHVSALSASVLATYPNARFEVLLPLDVNSAVAAGPVGAQVGGPLNHYVNIPAEWLSAATASFGYLKIEALAFGSNQRNVDLAREAIQFTSPTAWPGAQRRYLVPVFGTASPWQKEATFALSNGYGIVNFWALDHICLYGWNVTPNAFANATRSVYQG